MLTAIAVLIVSAVGGGVVGAFLTSQYPASAICGNCQEKAVVQQYQIDDYYQKELDAHIREQNRAEEEPETRDFPEDNYYEEYDPNGNYQEEFYPEGDYPAEQEDN